MKKQLIGLNRYVINFNLNEEEKMECWKNKNKNKYGITDIFVNNGYCLEVVKKRKIM
jgi:hypothetical protein